MASVRKKSGTVKEVKVRPATPSAAAMRPSMPVMRSAARSSSSAGRCSPCRSSRRAYCPARRDAASHSHARGSARPPPRSFRLRAGVQTLRQFPQGGAGHASASGRFDDEQLFYLQARGISESEARRLVVRGFLSELIQKIGVAEVEERLIAAVELELEKAGV